MQHQTQITVLASNLNTFNTPYMQQVTLNKILWARHLQYCIYTELHLSPSTPASPFSILYHWCWKACPLSFSPFLLSSPPHLSCTSAWIFSYWIPLFCMRNQVVWVIVCVCVWVCVCVGGLCAWCVHAGVYDCIPISLSWCAEPSLNSLFVSSSMTACMCLCVCMCVPLLIMSTVNIIFRAVLFQSNQHLHVISYYTELSALLHMHINATTNQ